MYHDTVAPLLLLAVAVPLQAALCTVEYANSSTPLGQTDWGALARGAYNWWAGSGQQKGGLVMLHLYGRRCNLRLHQMQYPHLQAYARSHRGPGRRR